MLILGIDPGTATTGYGFMRVEKMPLPDEEINGHFKAMEFGLIETDKENNPAKRLQTIHTKLDLLIAKYSPDVMAIEKLFFATNAKTAIRVGQAQGVMLLAAAKYSLEVVEYSPMTIKKMVTGSGRADKKLVQQSVRKVFGPVVRSKPHKKTHFDNAADALAVALTHAMKLSEL